MGLCRQMAQRQGKTSIYDQCKGEGEEAIACAQRLALEKGDMCFPTYYQPGTGNRMGYAPPPRPGMELFPWPWQGRQSPGKSYGAMTIRVITVRTLAPTNKPIQARW